MKMNCVMKKLAAAGLTASMVFTAAGSAVSVFADTYGYETVNGVTKGNYEVSTDDKGSASFNVEGNHVDMTNFSFDADEALLVEAEISDEDEEDLVYTHVYVHDEEYNVMQNLADGHYTEVFTQENAADAFNTLYKTVFKAGDTPIPDDGVELDDGLLHVKLSLSDGVMFILAKEGTDQYAIVALTTDEYGSQEILDTAIYALADQTASEETDDVIDDDEAVEAEDEVAPDEE